MTWTAWDRVVRLRRRHRGVNLAVEVLDGWRRHQSSRNASVLAYFGFLSLFPMVMVATTVLSIVLRNNPDLRDRIIESALSEVPVLGGQIASQAGSIEGDIVTLVIGLAIALWAATRAFTALQVAFDDVWEIPVDDRDGVPARRLKAVVAIVAIGSALAITGTLTNLPAGDPLSYWALNLAALGVNMAVLSSMMRLMTTAKPSVAMVWPGALFGAVGFTILHLTGALVVRRYLASASDVAGVFATVIALTAWINLLGIISLLGAELNAARHRLGNGTNAIDTVALGAGGR
jgi:YihY family inner membrane protein